MRALLKFPLGAVLACAFGSACWAARCTTVIEPALLREYENYVAGAERKMESRFASGELSWVPGQAAADAVKKLAAGNPVRWNISDAALNERLAAGNGTVLHWIGAVRIPGADLAGLSSVLEEYENYARFYRPMVIACNAKPVRSGQGATEEVALGLHNSFRFASLFPQHYSFLVKALVDRTLAGSQEAPVLRMHLRAKEIRESDSGENALTDLLEPYHDHGIMWALNAYWRARRQGSNIYLEFETISLARSVKTFACKIGFVPVPKSAISAAMDSMPAECIRVVLEGTRAECERRARKTRIGTSTQ